VALSDNRVLVIGGGVAGMTAALALANLGARTEIIEKSGVLGGHAARFTCKATDTCVKCGACMVHEKIEQVMDHPDIRVHLNSEVRGLAQSAPFSVSLYTKGGPEATTPADAVILAMGFDPFSPVDKPYGYGRFANVVTNLDLENRLRQDIDIRRPSDSAVPETVCFIQCVGSRDASLNHDWCSRVCCPSSLRMASLIQSKHEDMKVVVFFIDLQNCGKGFKDYGSLISGDTTLIRSIPGDIFETENGRLNVSYFDPLTQSGKEALFDMVVLSVGITPGADNVPLAGLLDIDLDPTGFVASAGNRAVTSKEGIFLAGTSRGPMGIAESAADAGCAAIAAYQYLQQPV